MEKKALWSFTLTIACSISAGHLYDEELTLIASGKEPLERFDTLLTSINQYEKATLHQRLSDLNKQKLEEVRSTCSTCCSPETQYKIERAASALIVGVSLVCIPWLGILFLATAVPCGAQTFMAHQELRHLKNMRAVREFLDARIKEAA